MSVLFANFLSGVVDDDPLLIGATTLTSSGLASLPVVASPDTMWIVLDPEASAGAPEIVQVTTHTASATTATIVRAQQSTTARQHLQNTVWRVAATAADLDTFFAITEDGAIDTTNLADDAVTTVKVVDEAVTLAKIDTDAYSPNSAEAESKLVQKGADGLMRTVGPPTASTHVPNKDYVDGSGGTLNGGRIHYRKHGIMVSVWCSDTPTANATLPAGFRPTTPVEIEYPASGDIIIGTGGLINFGAFLAFNVTFSTV